MDDINLELSSGMFGLLGPNGAGKSTLMRTIATLQYPDSGNISFQGQDIFSNQMVYRQKLGYLPQEFGVYPKESAISLLRYFAVLQGITSKKDRQTAIERVMALTNLIEFRHKKVSTFSGGMKQRFGIAQLLLNQPQIIIVDEPTAGLDPEERTRFLNVLRNIGSENIVIFSTHLVEDVKSLCMDMAVMNEGKVISQISPDQAVQSLEGKIWETEVSIPELEKQNISFLKLSDRYNEQNRLIQRIYSSHITSEWCKPTTPKLEDYYFLTLKTVEK